MKVKLIVATVSTIQLQFSRLYETITGGENSGDITKFNQYVKDKVRELSCLGATYSGLILSLCYAYNPLRVLIIGTINNQSYEED